MPVSRLISACNRVTHTRTHTPRARQEVLSTAEGVAKFLALALRQGTADASMSVVYSCRYLDIREDGRFQRENNLRGSPISLHSACTDMDRQIDTIA